MREIKLAIAAAIVLFTVLLFWDNRETLQQTTVRAANITVEWFTVALYAVLVLGALFGFVLILMVHRRQQDRLNRPKDGSFPIREYQIRNGVKIIVNPNHMAGAAAIVDKEHGFVELDPRAGWEPQITYASTVQTTHHLQALMPGDEAISSPNGAMYRGAPPKLPMQLLTPKLPGSPAVIDEERHQLPPPAPMLDNPIDFLKRSTPTTFAFGQSPETGEIAEWDVTVQPHLRLHGATQGGKSALGRLLVLWALIRNWRVVILDRRRFKDWHHFDGYAELCDATQPTALIDQLRTIQAEYGRVDRLLGQHRAPNIEALPPTLQPPRTLVVVEEFGIQSVNARADGVYEDLLSVLRPIVQEAAATGTHLLMIDQLPKDWHPAIRANVAAAVTFHQPQHSGQTAGYWAAHELPPYHFAYDGKVYKAPYVRPEIIAPGLHQSPPQSPPPPLIPVHLRLPAPKDDASSTTKDGGVFEATPAELTDKQRAIAAWIQANPSGSQAGMRAALGLSKGYASEQWNRFKSAPGQPTTEPARLASTDNIDLDSEEGRAEYQRLVASGLVRFPEPKE